MRSCINFLLGGSIDAVPVIKMFIHLSLKRLCSEYIYTGDKQKVVSSTARAIAISLTNKHVNTVITAVIPGVFDRVWQELVFASVFPK